MKELSLHILDVVENSLRAKAKKVRISILEDTRENRLELVIEDDGEGMDEETLKMVRDPFSGQVRRWNVAASSLINQPVGNYAGI